MSKTLDTLIEDIYGIFDRDDFDPALFTEFGDNVAQLMHDRFMVKRGERSHLRMSNVGRPDRQLYYDINGTHEKEALTPSTLIKFAYGDLIEQMLILFAKMAGHSVTHEQQEVEISGVKGHIDVIIDGVVVDIKSASPFSFTKFQTGQLLEAGNDPFGYVAQLSGYVEALTPKEKGAFLAADKVSGKLTLLEVPAERLLEYQVRTRVEFAKEMLSSPEVPPRCHSDVPDGKSGNMKLATACSYCAHKQHCWEGLRTYIYSTGPRFLTKVVREPKVNEEAW